METYVGDSVTFIVETSVDLTSFTTKYLKYKKPDGTWGKWNISFDGASPTIITCALNSGDLDIAGVWSLQAYVSIGASAYHGKIVDVLVRERIYLTTTPPTTLAPTTIP